MRQESLTRKGEVGPHAPSISGCSLHRQAGCLLGLSGRHNSPTGFCHKPYEVTMEPQSRAPLLFHAGCVIHSQKHTVELAKYSRKHACWETKELELQVSLPCPEESWMSPKMKGCCWTMKDARILGVWRRGIQSGASDEAWLFRAFV